jgi:hypothetical protein
MIDQEDQTPRQATAAAGTAMLAAIVDELVGFVAGMIDGTNVARIPPFHP